MGQMTVTLEWDDDLGPRWLNEDNLRSCLGNPNIRIKSITFPDSTAKERAQEELEQLFQRIDALGSLTYQKLMVLGQGARFLLENQYEAMHNYQVALEERIEAWIDEDS